MKHITHKLIIMLFMLMMAGGASAQKGFFGSISRSKGVEYFYTASVSRGNPNTNRGVPKIKGIDAEYLVSHISGIEMVSATRQDNGTDMTEELQKSVVLTIQEKEFETVYQINDDDQELILQARQIRRRQYHNHPTTQERATQIHGRQIRLFQF